MDKVTLSILVLSMGLFDRLFGNKKKEVGETVDSQSQEETLQEVVETSEQTEASSDTVKESVEVSEQAEIVNDTVEEVQDVVNVDSEAVSVETETFVQSKNSETVVKNTANQAEEISEATAVANEVEPDQHFSDIIADYYAKKAAAQEAIERGEAVTFEAVKTRQETEPEEVVVQEATETEEEKYNRSLKTTRTGFSARLNAFLANFRRVDEEFFEELEEMLILSDVGVNVATQLTEDLRYEAKLENAKRADDLKRVIIEKLVDIYEKDGVFNEKINFQDDLTVMLFVGVNGVGKTTSIGKLAYKYKNEGKKVMLVAADTFRAGAVAQLVEWGRRVGVPVVTGPEKADPASVVFDGMEKAVAENVDILLIDTAGRLQNKDNLMAELEKIGRIIKRVVPDAPHETLLALDASTGQNALSQAKEFSKITPLTGLILTKIDGTAKGGVVLAIRQELDIPVKFIGFGEKIDDIGEFDSEDFMRGLLEGIV